MYDIVYYNTKNFFRWIFIIISLQDTIMIYVAHEVMTQVN
jgi:hypothetical protein